MASVMADTKRPFLKIKSRWDYVSPLVDVWKHYIKCRTYAVGLAALGLYLLFTSPIVAALSFAGAAYFWQIRGLEKMRLESKRTVMIGH